MNILRQCHKVWIPVGIPGREAKRVAWAIGKNGILKTFNIEGLHEAHLQYLTWSWKDNKIIQWNPNNFHAKTCQSSMAGFAEKTTKYQTTHCQNVHLLVTNET